MDITIKGKLIARGEVKSGTSEKGNEWKGVDYTIQETDGRYPKKVNFTIFGVEQVNRVLPVLHLETPVVVEAELDAREYKGKYYNQIRAFKIQANGQEVLYTSDTNQPQQQPQASTQAPADIERSEELPF